MLSTSTSCSLVKLARELILAVKSELHTRTSNRRFPVRSERTGKITKWAAVLGPTLIGLGVAALLFCVTGVASTAKDLRPTLLSGVESGDLERVKRSLANGADPNEKYWRGSTPLMLAAEGGTGTLSSCSSKKALTKERGTTVRGPHSCELQREVVWKRFAAS